jgi:hypothetical protein
MINILSIRCGLAFAPYFLESAEIFLETGEVPSRVIRQAANGFIIRSEETLLLRNQNREAALDREDIQHFFSTVTFRSDFYDVSRTSDEVVLASVGECLLLSHPQSEMWVEAKTIPSLLAAFNGTIKPDDQVLPQWLHISGGDGRLLLSDQRSGRWVLLGSDHFAEFERRYESLNSSVAFQQAMKPPTIALKGVPIHLQSAFRLAKTFEEFAETGAFIPYEELTPVYRLMVARALEGLKISDSNLAVAVTAREARKWADIIKAELEKYQAIQMERGQIRTVLANTEQGCWILQWGDEVLVPPEEVSQIKSVQGVGVQSERLAIKRDSHFLLLLEKSNGNCIALTEEELKRIL